jgi:hypothetical protein
MREEKNIKGANHYTEEWIKGPNYNAISYFCYSSVFSPVLQRDPATIYPWQVYEKDQPWNCKVTIS